MMTGATMAGALLLGLIVGVLGAGIAAALLLRSERRSARERLKLLEEAREKLNQSFEDLSARALRQNNESFLAVAKASLGEFQQSAAGELEQRQKAIDALVQPLQKMLEQVGTKLQDIEKERHGQYRALSENLAQSARAQAQLQAETANLVQALRAPSVRGRWGEIQLRRVVELAGMLERCDFSEQATVEAELGRLRPDLIVHLPGGKSVVVDAKAPLEAYLDSLECTDDTARELKLREHARQVRSHIAKLSSKAYWEALPAAPEFVVLFLPGETFFSAALATDPGLIEYGVDRHVLPASPTTLIALLRAVAYGWQQEKLATNAQAISDLGRVLYERLGILAGHFEDVRKSLDRAVESYNRAVGSLESRVLVPARRFRELGVSASEELPHGETIERSTRRFQAPELTKDR
ncbi:MAG: DNA recombination protein RmuC [Myxococcota bacterium]